MFLTVFLTEMPAGDDQVFVGGESPTVCKGFTTCSLGFFQSAFKVTIESPRRQQSELAPCPVPTDEECVDDGTASSGQIRV